MFLFSLIDACCLALVKASLRACVAGCCHLLWHFCFVCSYVCCLSVPSSPCRLSFPRSFPNTKRKGKKITCTYWVDVVSCLVSPEVVSGRCAVILCSTTDLVPTSCACHLVLVCSSLGAGSMFASSMLASSMHSHRQKQTNLYSSKPESAREAPVKVKHPFQRTCVVCGIHLSARISDNTM